MTYRSTVLVLFKLFFTFLFSMKTQAQHIIPQEIYEEAKVALSHYPELANTPIEFKFKSKIRKSTMQAQPVFGQLFKSKKKRGYKILISEEIVINEKVIKTAEMPTDIMIGWLGHELGHVLDFKERSGLNLIGFGIGYLFSKNYIREAERRADTFAVAHGMEKYILATKEFILKKAGLSKKYVERIKDLYLSPEEIMTLVEERDLPLEGSS